MRYVVLDLLIAVWPISLISAGIKNIWRPADRIKRKRQKKKQELSPAPTRRQILGTRITGFAQLLLAVFIIVSLRFSLGWQEKPQVSMLIGDDKRELPYTKIIEAFVKDKNIPGMVVGIIDHHDTVLYGYGFKDYPLLKRSNPVDAHTLFEIGSLTKVFTGLMLAEAVQANNLELQMSVAELLETQTPQEVLLDPDITLEMLVTHTSGLPSIPLTLPMQISLLTLGITRGNPYKTISEQVMVNYFEKLQKVTEHGRVFNYSNYGFGLLGLIIAHNNGKTYEDSIQQLITHRLGMDSTLVHTTESTRKQIATGHHSFLRLGRLNIGRQSQYWDMHDAMASCGGIRSSGEDLLKFLNGLIEQQQLPFATLAQQPLYSINDQLDIGMAWLIQDDLLPNQKVVWHNGQTGGFNSYLGFVDHEHKGVFILSNLATTDVRPLGEELLQSACFDILH
ncbi:MAG TPA: hypothetical protein DD789_12475 [Firmicutes bacterium]|jgi:CubicO group peptidase (beta-lactamase class C family)|nr:hypothetical protein [Bacillota bacterium]